MGSTGVDQIRPAGVDGRVEGIAECVAVLMGNEANPHEGVEVHIGAQRCGVQDNGRAGVVALLATPEAARPTMPHHRTDVGPLRRTP